MGIIINSLITACSLSTTPMSQQACEKATQAGVQQLGIVQQVDGMEDHFVNMVKKEADRDIGKDGEYAVVGLYFVARTAQTKSVGFGLPTMGICDSIHVEIGAVNSLLRFEWKF